MHKNWNQGRFCSILIPHLTSFFLRFSHVWSLFLHLNMLGMCSFACPHFLGQVGVVNDPRICINFSVGSSFSARHVAHIERLHVAFYVAYDSASQSTFLCSVFFNMPIFPNVAAGRGVINHLFYGYYQLCGYFPSILSFFS